MDERHDGVVLGEPVSSLVFKFGCLQEKELMGYPHRFRLLDSDIRPPSQQKLLGASSPFCDTIQEDDFETGQGLAQ